VRQKKLRASAIYRVCYDCGSIWLDTARLGSFLIAYPEGIDNCGGCRLSNVLSDSERETYLVIDPLVQAGLAGR